MKPTSTWFDIAFGYLGVAIVTAILGPLSVGTLLAAAAFSAALGAIAFLYALYRMSRERGHD